MTADSVEHVISYWVLFQKFHSETLAGYAVISHWLPFLLFSVFIGKLADRKDCRKIIQVAQVLYMSCSALWAFLILTGRLQVWHAIVILLVHGMAGVIASPAVQLIIHDMVEPAQLPSAVRLNASSRYLAQVLGPALGGPLMIALGPAGGLFVNVLLYVPFTIFLLVLRATGHVRDGGSSDDAMMPVSWSKFFAQVRRTPAIGTVTLMAGVASFFVGNAFQAHMPEYARDFGGDSKGVWYSILFGANALGAVLGTIWLEVRQTRPTPRGAILFAAAWGTAMVAFAFSRHYPLALAALVSAGACYISFQSTAQTLVQILAPPSFRGRLVGVFNMSSMGLRAGAGLTVGMLGALVGVRWSLAGSAALVVVIASVLFARERAVRPQLTS
jgi:MFS family permease